MSKLNVKHTPGPWVFKRGKRNEFHLPQLQRKDLTTAILDEKGIPVAELLLDRMNANARLIAAAPDGHDILILLKRFIDEGATQISFGALMDTDDETTLGQALKAYFAKATGGTE